MHRVAAVDLARVDCDHVRVESALARHLDALDVAPLPVRWATDVEHGRDGSVYGRDSLVWWRARARARAAAKSSCGEWRPSHAHATFVHARTWEAVAEQACVVRASTRRVQELDPAQEIGPNPVAPWLQDALAWSRAPATRTSVEVAIWLEACLPFVDAYEAGLGFFWVLDDEIVAVPRPELSLVDGRLHNDHGPAVVWPDGQCFWFWEGVPVPRHAVEQPETLTVDEIHRASNMEVRRVLLERLGFDRYLEARASELVNEDAYGRLWRCDPLPDEREPLTVVEVLNSTPEPDGSRKRYFLRVPPTTTSAHHGVAWSFGFEDPKAYRPLAET